MKSFTRHSLAVLALALTAGCELLVRIDPSAVQTGGGGAGGGTTTTATTTSVTTSTTSTTTTTTTTTTTSTACTLDSECPTPSGPCVAAVCDPTTHTCTTPFIPAGAKANDSAQTVGTCKKVICDGAGMPSSVTDDTNTAVSTNPCVTYGCSNGTSVTNFASGATACTANSGKVCGDPSGSKAGTCVACNVIADCGGSNQYCQNFTCVSSTCMNGVQDPGETDVDCGGPCGPDCSVGQHCYAATDCASADCQGAAPPQYGVCVTATCSDNIENQGETDVDCGGMTCGPAGRLCATGKGCKANSDCQSLDCTPESNCPSSNCTGVCLAPTCYDGYQNENETDLDCGGPNCPGTCPDGKKCKIDGDCVTGDGCEKGANVCIAMCKDLHIDGAETDIDCGGGACNPCINGQKCKVDTDCVSKACDGKSFVCDSSQCADNRVDGVETDVDCGGTNACPRCPTGLKCQIDTDCVTGDGCLTGGTTCIGSCSDGHVDGVETDIDCGGANAACARCNTGLKCKVDTDCVTGDGCLTGGNICAITCKDGHKDGNETDIDCGGADSCARCGNGKTCAADSDCTSNACDANTLTCIASQCLDNRQDGSETDVDCGGSNLCSRCLNGFKCTLDSDCTSNACDGSSLRCVSNQCADHRLDGKETDTDCGGGTCPTCVVGKKCLGDSDCASGACDGITLFCDANQCADNRVDGVETDTDCGGGACPTCAVGKRCLGDSDCTANACDALSLTCVADQCSDHRVDGNETDIDCGGNKCSACILTKKCKLDSDCTTNACDALSLTCVANQCVDHQVDGVETDIDCGGGTCPTCILTKKCKIDNDCVSTACDGVSLTCVADQCSDHRVDGNETDKDCGGGTCLACPDGDICKLDSDCVSGGCLTGGTPKTCVNMCQDGHLDGAETDIDCGGGTCLTCALNRNCKLDSDCMSNACDAISHKCVASQCSDHQVDGVETDIDCGGGTCPACLAGDKCSQGSDCTSNSCSSGGICLCVKNADCTTNACDVNSNTCIANQCADHHKDGAETDIDCGGGTCPTCPVGDACTKSSDCASGDCFAGVCLCLGDADCPSNACDATTMLCVTDQCSDHRKDGLETDIDCGGGVCPACPVGDKCSLPADCASNDCSSGHICQCVLDSDCPSNACDAVSHLCVADQCSDHQRDGLETDVDCGGGVCPACLGGDACLVPSDCTSLDCSSSHVCLCLSDTDCSTNACDTNSDSCVTNQCLDHHKDGAETDVDCGGGVCPACPVSEGCTKNSDCASNDCVSGVCHCLGDADCPSNACDANTTLCVANQCADHRKDGAESDIDCGGGTCLACPVGNTCTGNGDCLSGDCVGGLCRCLSDTDCPNDACDANTSLCAASQCVDHQKDGAETDVDCGGGTCQACLAGLGCLVGSDCTSGDCAGADGGTSGVCLCHNDSDCTSNACDANTNTCVANQCADNRKDGTETDIDCGGATCPKCALNAACAGDSDCASNACDGISNKCVSSQCSDNRLDGTETDTDCGGPSCPKCPLTAVCAADSDCVSNACDATSNKCVLSQCSDHRLDGSETDVDCGGGSCLGCPYGDHCVANSDCLSNLCTGGVCQCTANTDCTTNVCDTVSHQCVASTCVDQVKDGTETDVDCGGSCSTKCPVGDACLVTADCASNKCSGSSGNKTCRCQVNGDCLSGKTCNTGNGTCN